MRSVSRACQACLGNWPLRVANRCALRLLRQHVMPARIYSVSVPLRAEKPHALRLHGLALLRGMSFDHFAQTAQVCASRRLCLLAAIASYGMSGSRGHKLLRRWCFIALLGHVRIRFLGRSYKLASKLCAIVNLAKIRTVPAIASSFMISSPRFLKQAIENQRTCMTTSRSFAIEGHKSFVGAQSRLSARRSLHE